MERFKIKIGLTKTGVCFLGLMFLFYFFSLISQIGLLYILIGIVFGCYAVNAFGAYRSVSKLELKLPEFIKTVEGKKVTTPVEVSNNSSFNIGLLEIKFGKKLLLSVSEIHAKKQVHISPDILYKIRGIYDLADLSAVSVYPYGLIRVSRKLNLRGKVIVYPAVYECEEPDASGVEPVLDGKFSGQHKSIFGNDFAGVRPFQSGDPVKYIHWKSSSKGQGVMVKQFNEKLSGRISFIIDNNAIPAGLEETTLDCAVRAVGSMVFSALDAGHHTEIIDLLSLKSLQVPPFSDGDIVLETLAGIEENNKSLNRYNIEKAVSLISSKASICFILSKINTDILSYIKLLRGENRTVSVYLPCNELVKGKNINKNKINQLDNCKLYYFKQNEIVESDESTFRKSD